MQFGGWAVQIIKIVLTVAVAWVVIRVSGIVINTVLRRTLQNKRIPANERKTHTLRTMSLSIVRTLVWFAAGATILGFLGLGTTLQSLMVTAGVGGLAIGFGAQNLIRDWITGFFILFDDQFGVGDCVVIGDIQGTVEAMYLRVTHVRGTKGELHILPNGSIGRVTNLSRGNAVAWVDIPVPTPCDMERVKTMVLNAACQWAAENGSMVTEQPVFLGVVEVRDASVVVRLGCRVAPGALEEAERVIRTRVVEALRGEEVKG